MQHAMPVFCQHSHERRLGFHDPESMDIDVAVMDMFPLRKMKTWTSHFTCSAKGCRTGFSRYREGTFAIRARTICTRMLPSVFAMSHAFCFQMVQELSDVSGRNRTIINSKWCLNYTWVKGRGFSRPSCGSHHDQSSIWRLRAACVTWIAPSNKFHCSGTAQHSWRHLLISCFVDVVNLFWDTVSALLAGVNLTCMSLCPKVLDFPTSPEQMLKLRRHFVLAWESSCIR